MPFFLEQYGNGWRCEPGVTFQVLAGPKKIDFYLPEHDTFLEYHPIKRYDWHDSEASRRYGEHFRKLTTNLKRESWEIECLEFARRYYDERRLVLNLTGHERSGLIVAGSSTSFYCQILRGVFGAPINENDFDRSWARFVNQAA